MNDVFATMAIGTVTIGLLNIVLRPWFKPKHLVILDLVAALMFGVIHVLR